MRANCSEAAFFRLDTNATAIARALMQIMASLAGFVQSRSAIARRSRVTPPGLDAIARDGKNDHEQEILAGLLFQRG